MFESHASEFENRVLGSRVVKSLRIFRCASTQELAYCEVFRTKTIQVQNSSTLRHPDGPFRIYAKIRKYGLLAHTYAKCLFGL